jgi:hypothetical protein
MLRKFFCVAFLAAFAVPAQAGILPGLAPFDGLEDELLDQGQASFLQIGLGADDQYGISIGDVFYGIVQIDDVDSDVNTTGGVTGTGGWIAGAFAFEVETAVDGSNAGERIYGFKNATGSNKLSDLLDSTWGSQISHPTDASIVLLSNPTQQGDLPIVIADPPALGALTSATWQIEAVGTIDATSDDFYQVGLAQALGQTIGLQRGGFTIIQDDWGSVEYLPVSTEDLGNNTTSHDFVLSTENATIDSPGSNGWAFASNGNFRINAVPEPASIATMFGVLGVCGLGRRRRRNG